MHCSSDVKKADGIRIAVGFMLSAFAKKLLGHKELSNTNLVLPTVFIRLRNIL